jgi:hypothetical protein
MGFGDALAKQQAVATSRYTFGLFINSDKPLVLICRHAGDGNPEFGSLQLKLDGERPVFPREPQPPATGWTQEQADAANAAYQKRLLLFRERFALWSAKVIAQSGTVVSWENAYEEPGAELAKCTPDKVEELLTEIVTKAKALDDFDRFTRHIRDASNFRDGGQLSGVDLGKG